MFCQMTFSYGGASLKEAFTYFSEISNSHFEIEFFLSSDSIFGVQSERISIVEKLKRI